MTIFKILLTSTGLSTREAARFLDVSIDSVKSWSSGRNNCPDGVLYELSALIDKQNAAAHAVPNSAPEIGYCTDDLEAQGLGWPCKSAHDAVIRRIFEYAPEELREEIDLVPRGSTVASAVFVKNPPSG